MPKYITLANQIIGCEDTEEMGMDGPVKIKVLTFTSPEAGPVGPLEVYRVPITLDFAVELAKLLTDAPKVDVFRTLPGT